MMSDAIGDVDIASGAYEGTTSTTTDERSVLVGLVGIPVPPGQTLTDSVPTATTSAEVESMYGTSRMDVDDVKIDTDDCQGTVSVFVVADTEGRVQVCGDIDSPINLWGVSRVTLEEIEVVVE